jgi:hypothetical protein
MRLRDELLVRVETVTFKSFKEKEHIMNRIRKKFNKVTFSFTDDLVIYQYYEKTF